MHLYANPLFPYSPFYADPPSYKNISVTRARYVLDNVSIIPLRNTYG